ncbi:MAG: transposase [Nitrospira sp.]|nr:transposase [Nitrospira sp.]MCS6265050.1 transposase [Nitrospira sp.]
MFGTPSDYAALETILAEVQAQTRIRIAAYCLMPKHWHLLI